MCSIQLNKINRQMSVASYRLLAFDCREGDDQHNKLSSSSRQSLWIKRISLLNMHLDVRSSPASADAEVFRSVSRSWSGVYTQAARVAVRGFCSSWHLGGVLRKMGHGQNKVHLGLFWPKQGVARCLNSVSVEIPAKYLFLLLNNFSQGAP